MEILKVKNVVLSPKSIHSAIAELDRTIEVQKKMKEHLEAVLSLGEGKEPVGERRKGGQGRRRKGEMTLRGAILGVLQKTKKPLKPVDLRDKVLKSGYPTSATPASLYTAVFNTARKEPTIVKTKEGFQLKRGRGGRSSQKKTKAKK